MFAATAAGAAPVSAAGSGSARDPAAPGPDSAHSARRLLQLRPALPLLHPRQLLAWPGSGGEGGQGPGRRRESAARRGRRQVRLDLSPGPGSEVRGSEVRGSEG